MARTDEPIPQESLRLWPGVVIVVLQWLAFLVVPILAPGLMAGNMGYVAPLGGLLGGLAVAVWWAFFSRAPRSERWGAAVLAIVALAVTSRFLHVSIATGMMGLMFIFYAIPGLSLAFVFWALAGRRLADGPRRAAMAATILLACGGWTSLRIDGITGGGSAEFAWRWTETSEERLLARADDESAALSSAPAPAETPEDRTEAEAGDVSATVPPAPAPAETPGEPLETQTDGEPTASAAAETGADWPGFRGPHRDGVISGVRIETDWSASPPVELWRRPIGPGWSSFAVRGDLFYTQEQRGDDEVVACYNVTTGEPVWRHHDATRFWEALGGAGPRATPTLSNGRVYTFGATGILNVLDAGDGAVVWSRNAASDTGAKLPIWGFSSSPLVVDDIVIVATSSALVAYDRASGDRRWFGGPADGESYSSPHLTTIGGVAQILQMSANGVTGVAPADGTLLWEHSWEGSPIVQPALTADGDILVSVSSGSGTRRIAVEHGPGGWTVEERWTSIRLKPYFNDFVVHAGHAYGFDGRILTCIDVEDGKRKWKGGRYGNGQLVLLADQDLLLVLSERGELALVRATPSRFTELASFPAIEGKTWNHPVLMGDLLLVRNGREMAAFRLSLAGSTSGSSASVSNAPAPR